ncbi:MAG: serine/threonine protein kinase [Pontiellaceae bacterium]|nr:serine/threonine protein kinase [Pontiellaceae bacterium]MBN2783836.1 serine/threonine protein kinase [Pontiellaceae bacterium]
MENTNRTPHELFEQANRIFMESQEIESDVEREAFLEQSYQSDDALREEVGRVFSLMEEAEPFFQESTPSRITASEIVNTLTSNPEFLKNLTEALPDDDEVGKQIGNYKLLHKIGEGGVGNVYLAEQSKPVRRQVALKIIKAGMDTKSVIARFEAERQALAMMEHPNIAHVLNAGETDTGRPFFVMELVHGEKITTYCNKHTFNIRQRLGLFIQVCHAIQHAHLKSIIHRDIKPSNVLVSEIDGTPCPVVIDFGIAKVIGEDLLTDNTLQTQMDTFIGTPSYMSPEQANHSQTDIDMRSDIYSLGVLLYELLVGSPPFDQKELIKNGVNEMRQILLSVDPLRPSVRLQQADAEERDRISRHCNMDTNKLVSILSGDLDWIVMKAMEKDRNLRYETANALSSDLTHFLNNEPVSARPPSKTYLLKKLIRRNKVVFASGTLIVMTISIGFGASSWLFLRERETRKRAVIAEQAQSQLRMEAENRERVTKAAYLLSQNKKEEADEQVSAITTLAPSLEAESVLRALGEWHALNARWDLALKRFSLLLQLDIMDQSSSILDDFSMAGPVMIERGVHEEYKELRRAVLLNTDYSDDPVIADRILKICLLVPADEEIMRQLKTLLPIVEESVQNQEDVMSFWRCTSLAIMAYRDHRFPDAIARSDQSRSFKVFIPVRIAIADIVQAMAEYRQGEAGLAQRNLLFGRATIEAEFAQGLKEGNEESGYWYDWLIARLLLQEAEALMKPFISAKPEEPQMDESKNDGNKTENDDHSARNRLYL